MKRLLTVMLAALALTLALVPASTSASAPTLIGLGAPPAPAHTPSLHVTHCAATGFNSDGTIAGICQYAYSTVGSGRGGGGSRTYTFNYLMTWNAYGLIVGLGAQTSTAPNLQGNGQVITINNVPYYCVVCSATGNELVSSNVESYLVLQTPPAVPAAPTVTVTQSGLNLQVSWVPDAATQSAITSSVVTATPSTGTPLTTTVSGSGTSTVLGPAQANTTYVVSVVNTDAAGAGAPGTATITTPASTVPPAATAIAHLWWSGGSSNLVAVSWTAPNTGDSPIDSYQVQVVWVDGDSAATGPYVQTVSGTTFSWYSPPVDNTSSWSVQVRAHNAAGWAPGRRRQVLSGL